MARKLHSRDDQGRHRVDLRAIRAPLRYAIALAAVGLVVGLAVLSWRGRPPVGDAAMAPIIPWLGGAVLAVLALALALRLFGRR